MFGSPAGHGCPWYSTIVVRSDQIVLPQGVLFAKDSSTLPSSSFSQLGELVKALRDRPGLSIRIEVRVPEAPATSAQALSNERANAVRRFLVEAKVPESRVTAKGLGAADPSVSRGKPMVEVIIVAPEKP